MEFLCKLARPLAGLHTSRRFLEKGKHILIPCLWNDRHELSQAIKFSLQHVSDNYSSSRLRGIAGGWKDGKHRFVIHQIAVVLIGKDFKFCLNWMFGRYTFRLVKSCSFLIYRYCYALFLLFVYSIYSFRSLSNKHKNDQCGFTCWFMHSSGKLFCEYFPAMDYYPSVMLLSYLKFINSAVSRG